MLSKKEYDDIVNKLKETPSTISPNTRKTLKKQRKEHEYSCKFAPFEPLPHIPNFVNRTTTAQTLRQIIQAATMSSEFVIDTESFNVFQQTNKPALIQLQIFLPRNSSFVLLIEVHHLPKNDHICFPLLQQLFQIIFTPRKKIFIFGLENELYPFTKFDLFSYDQIKNAKIINLQKEFKIFWNKKHPHRSTDSTSSTTSTNCICEKCIGKRSSETWSLQDCVAYLLNEYLPKTLTNENFQIGLDPNLFQVDPNEQQHRYRLSTYAKNDCLSMQRLIIQMKNDHFDFDSCSKLRISDDILDPYREDKLSINPFVQIRKKSRFIVPNLDDDLESISSDDDIPITQVKLKLPTTSNRINLSNDPYAPSIVTLENDYTLTTPDKLPMSYSSTQIPLIVGFERYQSDWESMKTNENESNTQITSPTQQPISTRQQPTFTRRTSSKLVPAREDITPEEKKKIHNRSCTLRQRNKYYRHEIIRDDIYCRFRIRQIKNIFEQHQIPFSAVLLSRSKKNKENYFIHRN